MTLSIADETFQALIRGGENEFVEFKSRALWSKSLSKKEIETSDSKDVHKFGRDTSKVIIAKTIAGFLNTEGGNLVIGIKENKGGQENEIIGVESEFSQSEGPLHGRVPAHAHRRDHQEIPAPGDIPSPR